MDGSYIFGSLPDNLLLGVQWRKFSINLRSRDVSAALALLKPLNFQTRNSGRLGLNGYGEHIRTPTAERRIADIEQ